MAKIESKLETATNQEVELLKCATEVVAEYIHFCNGPGGLRGAGRAIESAVAEAADFLSWSFRNATSRSAESSNPEANATGDPA